MTDARWIGYVALAGAVHAALLLSLRHSPSAPPQAVTPIASAEFDVEPDAPPDDAPAAIVPNPRAAKIAAARVEMHGGRPSMEETRSDSDFERKTLPAGELGAPVQAPGDATWTFDPRTPPDVTAPRFIARAAAAPRAEGPATGVSESGGLVEGLDAHDSSIGMGRGGPVISLLEAAARGADAPFEGTATFDVVVDTLGHASVALIDATSEPGNWSKVADATRASLVSSHMRIPLGARGWHVVAQLEARVQYPNGADPKKLGVRAQATPGRIKETKTTVEIELPHSTLEAAGKVCGVRIDLGLNPTISGGCNPENIGMQALRVVHGHVVSEGRL